MKTKIIAAFPGTGKTSYVNLAEYMPEGFAIDLDSSNFTGKDNFPMNYVEKIKQLTKTNRHSIIFVSSHDVVREALLEEGIDFTLAYPNKSLKIEYIKKYIDRGSPEEFIDKIYQNWDQYIDSCFNQKGEGCEHLVMNKGKYLSDYT